MSKVTRGTHDLTWVAFDVHRDSITSAVLAPDWERPVVDRFFPDETCLRRFLSPFDDLSKLRLCYEAGPTGYDLARLLGRLGVATEVIAPSLIPITPGAKVKTDKRDAQKLVALYRSGHLTPVHIPTDEEEAIRDLCRTRADFVTDRTRWRHRLSKFLLRHGEVYRTGKAWTGIHDDWLAQRRFSDQALTQTYSHYRQMLHNIDTHIHAVESDLSGYLGAGPFAEAVARLCAYRGVTELGALTLASEVFDWRRFPKAPSFMAFCGLIPSEYSSGGHRSQGHITKAGNTNLRVQLVESAWSYQYRPNVAGKMAKRQQRSSSETITRAWAAQQHLCTKFRRLAERKSSKNVVATAIARELSGFLWAEMTA
jgi:transposase